MNGIPWRFHGVGTEHLFLSVSCTGGLITYNTSLMYVAVELFSMIHVSLLLSGDPENTVNK